MRADRKLFRQPAPMVKKLWPEHSIENLERILAEYAEGEESAVFAFKADGEYVGVALC